jgi:hypothetical protein
VIRGVHRDRLGIVVDRDVGRAAERELDAARGAAAAGEVVGDDRVAPRADDIRRCGAVSTSSRTFLGMVVMV